MSIAESKNYHKKKKNYGTSTAMQVRYKGNKCKKCGAEYSIKHADVEESKMQENNYKVELQYEDKICNPYKLLNHVTRRKYALLYI